MRSKSTTAWDCRRSIMRRRRGPAAPFVRLLALTAAACCLAQEELVDDEVEQPETNATIETFFPTDFPTDFPTFSPTIGETTQPSVPPSEAPLYLVRDFLLEKKDLIQERLLVSYNPQTRTPFPSTQYTFDALLTSLDYMSDEFEADAEFTFDLWQSDEDTYILGLVNVRRSGSFGSEVPFGSPTFFYQGCSIPCQFDGREHTGGSVVRGQGTCDECSFHTV